MVDTKLWYLAHPYTAGTGKKITENVFSADKIAAKLISKGYHIYSPISHTHQMHLAGVHLGLWDVTEWQMWMDLDKVFIEACHGIIMSPGWEESTGCVIEYRHFHFNNKEILFVKDILSE